MPKLSIIVPVYNTEKYLRECVDSILAQTFADFELILVDDGSTDGSGVICDEYAAQDLRVCVIHQKNAGVTSARKAAMRIAEGRWIAFVDSDDWISPDMFETMLDKATAQHAEIVVCDAYLEFSDRSQIAGSLAEEGFYDKAGMMQKIYPTMIMDLQHRRPGIAGWLCNKLFSKTLLESVFWSIDDSYVYSEDALCSYAALLECKGLYICRIPLYYYRQHAASAVHQYSSKRYEKALYAYYAYEKILQNRGFDISEQINAFVSVNAVGILRKVLLFDRQTALRKRIQQARQFASDALVQTALSVNVQKMKKRSDRWKTQLVLKRQIFALYLLLAVRLCMLKNAE